MHVGMSLNDDPSTLLKFPRSIIYCQLPICHSSPPTILHMYRKFHKRHVGSVPGAHWTRALKRNNKIYYQYGVGKQKRLTPDFWFTCKMEPRANASEADVREICRVTAFALDYHRNHRYRRCACNFESLRESRGRCKLSWFHVYRKVTGHLISKGMDAHDRYCSCGCFDVQKRDVEY